MSSASLCILRPHLAFQPLNPRNHAVDSLRGGLHIRLGSLIARKVLGGVLHGAELLLYVLLGRTEHFAVVLVGHLDTTGKRV